MRILIAGSRNFHAGYRVDRALLRASKGHRDDMTVVTIGERLTRRGADSIARDLADEFGWQLDRSANVSGAQADLCLAFLHTADPHDDRGRVTALKAEKAGIPVWRYYEGEQPEPHITTIPFDAMALDDLDPETPVTIDLQTGHMTFTVSDTTYTIMAA